MRSPLWLRGLAVIGALALVGGGIGLAMALPSFRSGFSAREEPSAVEAGLARTLRSMSIPSRYKTMKNPLQVTPELLADARAHWADHCATCHGNDGSGQSGLGKRLYPRSPDMRSDRVRNMSDGELYYVIENGIRLTGMPAWGDGRDDSRDSWSLVAFIRTLPKLTTDDLNAMRELNPKSAAECAQAKSEEDFLNGDADGSPQTTEHSHE